MDDGLNEDFGYDRDIYCFDTSLQASDSYHVDINPEVICNDDAAWEKEVVPAFAELGFVCTWTSVCVLTPTTKRTIIDCCQALQRQLHSYDLKHVYREVNQVADILSKAGLDAEIGAQFMEQPPPQDNKMGFSIDPKLGPLEDTSVFFRAVNALNAFASGLPAHWALKPLSGDMEFDSYVLTPTGGMTEEQFVERYTIFKGLYQDHPELQALPCFIRFYDEPDIYLVASKLLIFLLGDFLVEFIKFSGDFESLAKEFLKEHERLKDRPFPYDDTMETGKAPSGELGTCNLST